MRIIQRLLHKDKLLKKIAGKTFCASLLNLAAGAVAEECSSFKVDVLDSDKLLFELENPEDSGSESDIFEAGSSNLDQSSLAPKDVEPGYEADAELDNALSDVSGKENGVAIGGVGREKEISPRRHSECVEGHIFYPQMCEQLVYFLEHTGEMTALVCSELFL